MQILPVKIYGTPPKKISITKTNKSSYFAFKYSAKEIHSCICNVTLFMKR